MPLNAVAVVDVWMKVPVTIILMQRTMMVVAFKMTVRVNAAAQLLLMNAANVAVTAKVAAAVAVKTALTEPMILRLTALNAVIRHGMNMEVTVLIWKAIITGIVPVVPVLVMKMIVVLKVRTVRVYQIGKTTPVNMNQQHP